MSDTLFPGPDEPSWPPTQPVPMASPVNLEESAPPALPTARPPRVWSVFAVATLAILATVAVATIHLLASGIIRAGSIPDDVFAELAKTPSALLVNLAVSMAVLGTVAMLAALISPVNWRERLGLRTPAISGRQMASAALGAISIGWMFSMADMLGLVPRSATLESLGEATSGLLGTQLMGAVLVIGIMPGICEELLFRGYMQTRLTMRWGMGWSIPVTAFIFGAYHLDLGQGMFAMVMGIYLGLMAERAASIIPAMIAHAANNSFGVMLSAVTGDAELESTALIWALLILGLIILIACIVHLILRPNLEHRVSELSVSSSDGTD